MRHGPLTLIIPDGALDGPTAITIAEVEDAPRGAVGPAFDLGPDGLEFRVPATLLIAYGDADLPPGTDPHGLGLSVLDRGRWAPVEGRANDSATRTVRAPLGHFSIYGIVAEPRSVAGQGTRLEANGVVLEASAPVYGRLFVSPYYVSAYLDAGAAGDVTVTFSGLPTDADTYAYLGSYAEERLVRAADGGRARFVLDLRDPVLVWFQPAAGTTFIGGPLDECGTVGVRDGNVCRLTSDIVGSVQLMAGTLDCDGHAIRQAFADRETGIGVFIGPTDMVVGIRNCTIGGVDSQFAMGADGFRADRPFVTDNRIEQNLIGVRFVSTTSGSVVRNVVAGSDLWSIALWDASARNEIANNSLPGDHGGITMDGVRNDPTANTGNVVRDNRISGGSAGFLFQNAQGNEVRRNDRDGGSAGLHIYPSGWPNRVYWNNFVGWTWLGVLVAEGVPDMPIEISHDGKGNHWGRTCPGPLFTPGVDSNRADVTDSFAYAARDAWLVGGVPGCPPLDTTPPDPPVIRLPAEGDVVFTSTPTIIGAAEPDSAVTVLEGSIVIGTALATESGEFAVVAAPPLAAGPHTIHATAVDAAGNESVPSAARTFSVRPVSDVEPLVAAARKFQVVELADFPDPLESALAPNRLRIVAKVDPVRGLGGASRNHRFLAIGRRALRDSATGRVLHTTLGFTEIPNVAGSAGEPVQVVVADHWCGAAADGRQVEAGRAYPYDLSVKLVRQYVGRGVGSRCSRGEQLVDVGPGASACLIDSLDVSNVGVVNVAAVAPAAERPRPYCSADLVMLTDKARGLSWPDLVYDRPYFTGALVSIWGEDFAITPSAVGCERRMIEDQAACVLGVTTAFGIDRPDLNLRLIGVDVTSTNHRIVRFQQVVQRWDVDGSQVLVTFAPDGKVTEVTSHFIPDLRVVNSRTGDYAADFAAFDRTAAEASVLSALSRLGEPMPAPPVLRFRDEVIFVDHAAENSEGRLAVYVVAEAPDAPDRKYIAVVDAADARVLLVRPVTAGAGITVDTQVAYPAFSEDRCTPPEECPHPYDHCSPLFVDGGRCVDRCSVDVAGECSSMDPWASCAPHIYDGTCTVRTLDAALRVYADGWTSPEYSAFLPYATLVDDLVELRRFFAEDLGRRGWDDPPEPIRPLPFHTYLIHSGGPTARPPLVYVPVGSYADFPGSSMQRSYRYRTLAHEWGHNLVTCTTAPCRPCGECLDRGTPLTVGHDCLGEGIADLYGALFAVQMPDLSSTSWIERWCPGGIEFRETPWQTRSHGLARCDDYLEYNLPYALRSRFDCADCRTAEARFEQPISCLTHADCAPYLHCPNPGRQLCMNNPSVYNCMVVWNRFGRLLAEGSRTLELDGTGEDIGLVFDGIGYPAAVDVVHDATRRLTSSSRLFDWVDALMKAALAFGRARTVVPYALGAIGLARDDPIYSLLMQALWQLERWWWGGRVAYVSDRAPAAIHFGAWTLNPYKGFRAWRDPPTAQVKVAFGKAGRSIIDSLGGTTFHSPAVVEYNGLLHVFWNDATHRGLRVAIYQGDSTRPRIDNLVGMLPRPVGGLDAVVFRNSLYLVYTMNGGQLALSRCIDRDGGCFGDPGRWHDFGGGRRWYLVPGEDRYAPSPRAVAARGVHGTLYPAAEYLYVVGAVSREWWEGWIRVVQIDEAGWVRLSAFVPPHYPSFRTRGPVDVRVSQSAFGEQKYLYLAWADWDTSEVHVSIVQEWNDMRWSAWFTRSAPMGIAVRDGPSWWRGVAPEDPVSTLATVRHPDGRFWSLSLYGRY